MKFVLPSSPSPPHPHPPISPPSPPILTLSTPSSPSPPILTLSSHPHPLRPSSPSPPILTLSSPSSPSPPHSHPPISHPSCTRYGFRALLEQRCADIIQPDITWVGGITEVRASLATLHLMHPFSPPSI